MWRSFFIAMGCASALLGAEMLAIDKATLTLPPDGKTPQNSFLNNVHETLHQRDFVPPDWAPWTFLSAGAVIVLYTCTVAKD